MLSVRFLISSRLLVKFERSPNLNVGFPDGSAGKAGKESACNAGDTGEVGSIPGSEDPLEKERKRQTTPVFLLEKSHGVGLLTVGVGRVSAPNTCIFPELTVF